MTKYELIVESLQARIVADELTLEDASVLNDIAYNKYVVEGENEELSDEVAKKYDKELKEIRKRKSKIKK